MTIVKIKIQPHKNYVMLFTDLPPSVNNCQQNLILDFYATDPVEYCRTHFPDVDIEFF